MNVHMTRYLKFLLGWHTAEKQMVIAITYAQLL